MTDQTEPLDLDAIEARTASATPGPWTRRDKAWEDGRSHYVTSAAGTTVALGGYGPARGGAWTDANFIAHARTDVPALLAEVRRLRMKLADAWDEGFATGRPSVAFVTPGWPLTPRTPNPYRQEQP